MNNFRFRAQSDGTLVLQVWVEIPNTLPPAHGWRDATVEDISVGKVRVEL